MQVFNSDIVVMRLSKIRFELDCRQRHHRENDNRHTLRLVKIEQKEYAVDKYLSLAVSPGVICCHLCDLVDADGKYRGHISIAKVIRLRRFTIVWS